MAAIECLRTSIWGPQCQQAFVCEWKRRSLALPYSAAQSGHGVKRLIEVRSRSNGIAATIEYRGPQSTQLTNA